MRSTALLAILMFVPMATAEVRVELKNGVVSVQGVASPKSLRMQVSGTDAEIAERPAMLGKWESQGTGFEFHPRFPLTPGVTYRVSFDSGHQNITIPKIERKPTTIVENVYPTGDVLAENHLRFYFHFSAPMRYGDVYAHIRLIDEKGKTVVTPWLELDEELWDASGKRFTLLIHPGRIKSGLRPREDLGPVLEPNKRYTLIIDTAWEDENGQPLKQEFRKSFRVVAGTDRAIDTKAWKITPPDGKSPLVVKFDRPLDHALVQRMLRVFDANDHEVSGKIDVSDAEKVWTFTPNKPMVAGTYRLVANVELEDYAGNRIDRPFEVETVRPIERTLKAETIAIPFVVK